jgi:hypothetical protein
VRSTAVLGPVVKWLDPSPARVVGEHVAKLAPAAARRRAGRHLAAHFAFGVLRDARLALRRLGDLHVFALGLLDDGDGAVVGRRAGNPCEYAGEQGQRITAKVSAPGKNNPYK